MFKNPPCYYHHEYSSIVLINILQHKYISISLNAWGSTPTTQGRAMSLVICGIWSRCWGVALKYTLFALCLDTAMWIGFNCIVTISIWKFYPRHYFVLVISGIMSLSLFADKHINFDVQNTHHVDERKTSQFNHFPWTISIYHLILA